MTEASRPGRCSICYDEIEEGDAIEIHEGDWCHARCVDDLEAQDDEAYGR